MKKSERKQHEIYRTIYIILVKIYNQDEFNIRFKKYKYLMSFRMVQWRKKNETIYCQVEKEFKL